VKIKGAASPKMRENESNNPVTILDRMIFKKS